jgi:PAS domain S-box-containing protein
LGGLEHNHYDVPLALMYSIVDPDDTATTSHSWDSTNSLKLCLLEGAVGIPIGHTAASPKLDLTRSQEGFTLALREAMRTREPTTISERDGSLPAPFLKGIKCRGFGDPCKEAVVFPLRPPNEDSVLAFLLLGINPRKAVDDDYRTFITLLNRQLETSLSSVILFEDEVRRNKQAAETAAKQEEQLLKQLELQTGRMRRMTELSPLGMYLFDPRGVLVEANEKYMEMTGFRRGDADAFAFLNVVAKESQTVAHEMWDEMMTTMKPVTREIQLKPLTLQPRDLSGDPIEYWVLASSAPQLNSNGEVISIMGSLADISHMKWVHGLQETRLREAEETKRQQNEFVDITSHEMR